MLTPASMTILASARLQRFLAVHEARPSRPEAENGGRDEYHNVCRGDTCIPYLQRECGRELENWDVFCGSARYINMPYWGLASPAGPHVGLSLPVSAVWHDSCKATEKAATKAL